MDYTSATKKKKRKTRKCLDELRKRSRLTISKASQQPDKLTKSEVPVLSNRLITRNRLTLNMFPKAIRSETITRPLLEELKQQQSICKYKELHDNHKLTSTPRGSQNKSLENCISLASNSLPLFDFEDETLVEHQCSPMDIPTRDSLNIYSPISTNNLGTPPKGIFGINSTSTASLSSETDDHEIDLHQELMNKISSHLTKVSTAININEDIINNTKIDLHKLFTKSRSDNYHTNMLDETSVQSSRIPILQDPMNYIRLKQQYNVCFHGFSETFSPLTPSPAMLQESPDQIKLFDTPEYNYYPHMLN